MLQDCNLDTERDGEDRWPKIMEEEDTEYQGDIRKRILKLAQALRT
jgi:hypothetical protein